MILAWKSLCPDPAALRFIHVVDGHDIDVRFEVGESGLPEIAALTIVGSAADPITATLMHQVRVPELLRHGRWFLVTGAADGWETIAHRTEFDFETIARGALLIESGVWDDADYIPDHLAGRDIDATIGPDGAAHFEPAAAWQRAVATAGPSSEFGSRTIGALYRRAIDLGVGPNAFVARMLAVSRATASNWIRAAREVGTIEPSTRKPRARPTSPAGNIAGRPATDTPEPEQTTNESETHNG